MVSASICVFFPFPFTSCAQFFPDNLLRDFASSENMLYPQIFLVAFVVFFKAPFSFSSLWLCFWRNNCSISLLRQVHYLYTTASTSPCSMLLWLTGCHGFAALTQTPIIQTIIPRKGPYLLVSEEKGLKGVKVIITYTQCVVCTLVYFDGVKAFCRIYLLLWVKSEGDGAWSSPHSAFCDRI